MIFGNQLRSFIVGFLTAKKEATWTEIKTAVERWTGSINPNTLSFHLGELAEAGFITKIGLKPDPIFKIMEAKK